MRVHIDHGAGRALDVITGRMQSWRRCQAARRAAQRVTGHGRGAVDAIHLAMAIGNELIGGRDLDASGMCAAAAIREAPDVDHLTMLLHRRRTRWQAS